MRIIPLTDGLAVAGQVLPEEMQDLAAQGYRAVIGNRPDDEEPGQPSSAEVAAAARAAGLEYIALPVTMATIDVPVATEFVEKLAQAPGPVLAHCRSGTRTTVLWALGSVATGKETPDSAIAKARAAGYDLAPYRARFAAAAPR
jgi:uncharacterized protein (TIGR01244 family)